MLRKTKMRKMDCGQVMNEAVYRHSASLSLRDILHTKFFGGNFLTVVSFKKRPYPIMAHWVSSH